MCGMLATLLLGLGLCGAALAPARAAREPIRAAQRADDELVREFQKYYKKYTDSATRVEAILALQGEESGEVVLALAPLLGGEDAKVEEALRRVLAGFASEPPRAALGERLAAEKDIARRAALIAIVAQGGYASLTGLVRAELGARAWELRRASAAALARLGDVESAPAIAALAADGEVAVHCAALDALADLKSESAVDLALADLAHPSWQVRASAVRALGLVRSKRAIEPLIERLGLEQGRLQEDVGAALAALTGRNFGQRQEAWRSFWEGVEDRFELPTDAELAELAARQQKTREKYVTAPSASFVGIDTPSRRILFVIDVSGSMEQQVTDLERFADGGYPSMQRMDIVKTELARTVARLEGYVEFNILAFATEVDAWKKKPVAANVLNKSSAANWIERLEAIGGQSKEDLARAGLQASANLEAGRTNTWGALAAALAIGSGEDADRGYAEVLDTVFFLSDGRPTYGLYTDPDDILRAVREANALRKVAIHTIGIGDFEVDFMQSLAAQNGGVFVSLGK